MKFSINRYFVRHPEMVLGTWSRKDTLYGEGYSVLSNGDLAKQLQDAIGRLPRFAPPRRSAHSEKPTPTLARPPPKRHVTEGGLLIDDYGAICQCIDGQTVAVEYGGTTLRASGTLTGRRLAALIRLRDLARRVLQSQNEGWPDAERENGRHAPGQSQRTATAICRAV